MLINSDVEKLGVNFPTARSSSANGSCTLDRAVLRTAAYADVFDYPLTVGEIHAYLIERRASLAEVKTSLDGLASRRLVRSGEYYTLPGREQLVPLRRERGGVAVRLWPKALRYGRAIAGLPYVRMVALTGALAVDNVASGADLDYLVVTAPGRLWLCRAAVILLVRRAALAGDTVCPNYFLAESALEYPRRNLYAAHEIAQMVPLAGMAVYRRMIRLNPWVTDYLPNAVLPPRWPFGRLERSGRSGRQAAAEALLNGSFGAKLERWEMARKLEKFNRRKDGFGEVGFCADWCKGHFDGHERRTLSAYAERLRQFEAAP